MSDLLSETRPGKRRQPCLLPHWGKIYCVDLLKHKISDFIELFLIDSSGNMQLICNCSEPEAICSLRPSKHVHFNVLLYTHATWAAVEISSKHKNNNNNKKNILIDQFKLCSSATVCFPCSWPWNKLCILSSGQFLSPFSLQILQPITVISSLLIKDWCGSCSQLVVSCCILITLTCGIRTVK